jgi:hypothetical protein
MAETAYHTRGYKMKKSTLIITVVVLCGLLIVPTLGAQDGKVLLVSEKVDFETKKAVVEVGKDEGKFRELFFDSNGSDIEIYKLSVVYPNGRDWTIGKRMFFSEDRQTTTLDLPGKKRHIKKIVFYYRPNGAKAQSAEMEIYGVR